MLDSAGTEHYGPPVMGMIQRLGRFVVGGRDAIADPTDILRQAYSDACERMNLLQQHAELAPQAYSQEALRTLARAAGEQIERIRAVLREQNVGLLSEPPSPTSSGAAANHWGRLVQDLERHQESSARCREWAVELSDSHPTVAAFLERVCQEDARTCERLRALIARADPQALD